MVPQLLSYPPHILTHPNLHHFLLFIFRKEIGIFFKRKNNKIIILNTYSQGPKILPQFWQGKIVLAFTNKDKKLPVLTKIKPQHTPTFLSLGRIVLVCITEESSKDRRSKFFQQKVFCASIENLSSGIECPSLQRARHDVPTCSTREVHTKILGLACRPC